MSVRRLSKREVAPVTGCTLGRSGRPSAQPQGHVGLHPAAEAFDAESSAGVHARPRGAPRSHPLTMPEPLDETSEPADAATRPAGHQARTRDPPAPPRAGLPLSRRLPPGALAPDRGDIVFTRKKVVVFVDGCFWHGCPDHATAPKNNAEWWREKLAANVARDIRSTADLRRFGWTVIRAWEHEEPDEVVKRVASCVSRPAPSVADQSLS